MVQVESEPMQEEKITEGAVSSCEGIKSIGKSNELQVEMDFGLEAFCAVSQQISKVDSLLLLGEFVTRRRVESAI